MKCGAFKQRLEINKKPNQHKGNEIKRTYICSDYDPSIERIRLQSMVELESHIIRVIAEYTMERDGWESIGVYLNVWTE